MLMGFRMRVRVIYVKARPLKANANAGGKHSVHRLPALWANVHGLVAHLLKNLKIIAA